MSSINLKCDVLIVGGGLVGSTLAYALAQAKISTVLLEAHDPDFLEQPSFDDRVTALANGSQRIFQGLGLWDALKEVVEPIKSIHISERGCFGTSKIIAEEEGVSALGYTIENRVLGDKVWSQLSEFNSLTCLAPAKLDCLSIVNDAVTAGVKTKSGRCKVQAKLVVAADGVRSKVREEMGISVQEYTYEQHAIIFNCQTEIMHHGQAFERFTSNGPLAFLPLRRDRMGVVWTLDPKQAEKVISLDNKQFALELKSVFGSRLGRINRIGSRATYPLKRVRSDVLTARRSVLLGNAALSLHPVAGQGFNLALRDIAAIAELLADTNHADSKADLGNDELLACYQASRLADQRRVSQFTHGLVRLFGYNSGLLAMTRGLGLMTFDLLPGAKATLARQTMGLNGRLSRLSRGLPLSS
ncbi:MAG: 2-octaprenyl-6-methoxyphenyl hydroxylase [Rhodospirillaceae bacterium]|nr:2-octaprenyl-6-methoxyphenyl hydroxylase [Rhodospirillaceae bacterium]